MISCGYVDNVLTHKRPYGRRVLGHDFLALNKSGRTLFEFNGRRRRLAPNTLVYVKAGTEHQYDPLDNYVWNNYWLTFNYKRLCSSLKTIESFIPDEGFYILPDIVEIETYWQKLSLSFLQEVDNKRAEENFLLHALFYSIHSQVEIEKQPESHTSLQKIITVMHQSIEDSELNLQDLCKRESLGYHNFRKLFKKHTGTSPRQYLINLRINRARVLLRDINLNINSVAVKSGFTDFNYFCRLFKSHLGLTPREYRNEQRIKQ
ncbi:MAG: helix-turn-helix domain-containing protein [Planctomycetota bacterium]|jgi:AraC-like DNA-binding protein